MPLLTKDALPNELLQYERARKNWTQEDVAERLEPLPPSRVKRKTPRTKPEAKLVDVKTIGKWERGTVIPTPHYQRQLAALYGRSEQELGYPEEDKIPFWHVNLNGSPIFTGREDILQELARIPDARNRCRQESLPPQVHRPQVLTGLPGVGKTQIAIAYAHRYCHEYHTIILLDADPRLQPDKVAFAKVVAKALNLAKQDPEDPDEPVAEVTNWLSSQFLTRWLLIFDNVDSSQVVEAVMDFLPQQYYGHVLLISRMDDPGAEIYDLHHIRVPSMTEEEGATLLLRRIGCINTKATITEASEDDRTLAVELSSLLEGLPLALDQAGAYIRGKQKTLHDYARLYKTRRRELLHMRGKYASGHPDSVAITFSLCFEQAGDEAQELLRLFAFLAPNNIPKELVTKGAPVLGPILGLVAKDEVRLDESIENLLDRSLIVCQSDKAFTVHPLVQVVMRDQMDNETQRQWVERVAAALHQLFSLKYKGPQWFPVWRYSDLFVCASDIEKFNVTTIEAVRVLWTAGKIQLDSYHLKSAEYLCTKALTILAALPRHVQQHAKAELLDIGIRLTMAKTFEEQGIKQQRKLEQAKNLYKFVLMESIQRSGPLVESIQRSDPASSITILAVREALSSYASAVSWWQEPSYKWHIIDSTLSIDQIIQIGSSVRALARELGIETDKYIELKKYITSDEWDAILMAFNSVFRELNLHDYAVAALCGLEFGFLKAVAASMSRVARKV